MASWVATANRLRARAYCRRQAFGRSSSNARLDTEVLGPSARSQPMTYAPPRFAVDFVVGRY